MVGFDGYESKGLEHFIQLRVGNSVTIMFDHDYHDHVRNEAFGEVDGTTRIQYNSINVAWK